MDTKKKNEVHYSSLIDLKAEFIRKKEEVCRIKIKQNKTLLIKKSKLKNQSKKVEECSSKNYKNEKLLNNVNSRKTLEESKVILEAKSRLYEKLSNSQINLDMNFLVDFEQKNNQYHDPKNEMIDNSKLKDNFVEYKDCFGRNKKCLKKDFHKIMAEDEILRKKINKPLEANQVSTDALGLEFFNEKIKQKWEDEHLKLINKTDIHYQDILFDEARTHGVGYFAFSQNEKERAKQQDNLSKIREETKQIQKSKQQINEKKIQIQQNRLKVAQLRRRLKTEILPEKTIDNPHYCNQNKNNIFITRKIVTGENVRKKNNQLKYFHPTLETKDVESDAYSKLLKNNQWHIMNQNEWISKKRNERDVEFRPTDGCPVLTEFSMTDFQTCSNTEDNIAAGLKYLRHKFEKKKS